MFRLFGSLFLKLGVTVYCSFLTVAWIAFFTAELSVFRIWICITAFAVSIPVFFILSNVFLKKTSLNILEYLIVSFIALCSLLLTLPASEMLLGGWDPGVYLHTAGAIAEQGSLQFDMEDLADLPEKEKPLFTRKLHNLTEPFLGMRILPNSKISPQFFHLYPCIMAVIYSLGGIRVALLMNPLLNVGCILLIFILAKLLLGKYWGITAALFLCLNPAQIWQGKLCTSEMLVQFLILGGFCFLIRAITIKRTSMLLFFLSGFSFGMAMITRYDTLILMAPLITVIAISPLWKEKRNGFIVFAAVFFLFSFQTLLHTMYIAPYYKPLHSSVILVMLVIIVLIPCLSLIGRKAFSSGSKMAEYINKRKPVLLMIAGIIFVIWGLYTWLIRPYIFTYASDIFWINKILNWVGQKRLASYFTMNERYNMLYLVNTIGSIALGIALTGTGFLFFRADKRGIWIWLFPSAAVTVFLVTNVFHDHFMLWITRRFIPVVFPFLAISAAAGVKWISGFSLRFGTKTRFAAATCLVLLVLFFNTKPILTAARIYDWPGLCDWTESMAGTLPDNALLYCDQPGFAAPFRFLYGIDAYELHFPSPERIKKMIDILAQKVRAGNNIFILTANKLPDKTGFIIFPVARFPMKTYILSRERLSFPQTRMVRGGDFVLYKISELEK
ncbi:MAG: hypothetical protein P9M03_07880 [Candidatus Theseobacter exili]|nr:hypothetical protein [Candidatus Theseobacter exili]